jgi:hypothetical protein
LLVLIHLGPVAGLLELVRGDAKWASWADLHGFLGCSMLPQCLCVGLSLPSTTVVVSVVHVNVLVALVAESVIDWHVFGETDQELEAMDVSVPLCTREKPHSLLLHFLIVDLDLDRDLLLLQVLICLGVFLAGQCQRSSVGVQWEGFPDESRDIGRQDREGILPIIVILLILTVLVDL